MNRLRDALRNEFSGVPLDEAALELASIEFPAVDIPACLLRLDQLAGQIHAALSGSTTGLTVIRRINSLLFDTLKLEGNREAYYDPRNSCLNSVLTRRLGIPITLSVVYMEVGRRLSQKLHGVGLPGHFIVAYESASSQYLIDPFNHGRILSFVDCCELARQAGGVDICGIPGVLTGVTKRQILIRMLSNLKAIYLRGAAFDKARIVLDLLVEATPNYAGEYRSRGLIHLRQLNYRAAQSDLETYLRLEPSTEEREQIETLLIRIARWKAGLN